MIFISFIVFMVLFLRYVCVTNFLLNDNNELHFVALLSLASLKECCHRSPEA